MASIFRRGILLLIPVLSLLASCSEDFKVGAPYKPVTVAYGLLNMGDTAHYIRIQKAFLDENKSALDLAQIPDSNYFGSLNVHLKQFENGVLKIDETLPRVDLAQENFIKQTGVFFNSPNYAYKSKMALKADAGDSLKYIYRLVVTNTSTGEVDSAETPVINSNFSVDEFYSGFSLAFPGISQNAKFELTVRAPANGEVFEGIIRFRWVDVNNLSGTEAQDSVDWTFATGQKSPTSPGVKLSVSERSFYSFLREAMGEAPANVTRKMSRADMIVWAGSKELQTYRQINGAQGGLTADQIKPVYTNLKGANVYGLFASRAVRSYRVFISEVTLDSLKTNIVTRPLNINGRSLY
jgi:hypothetical protein